MLKNKNTLLYATGFIAAIGLGICAGNAYAGHINALLSASLDGNSEVETMGDADGMGHARVFGIDGDATTLCYTLEVSGIQLVAVGEGMAAHIHEGKVGTNGGPVAVLAGPEDGNAADCITEGEKGKFPTNEAGIVERILKNPDDFYINVHNPAHALGAIRGQLANLLKNSKLRVNIQ